MEFAFLEVNGYCVVRAGCSVDRSYLHRVHLSLNNPIL